MKSAVEASTWPVQMTVTTGALQKKKKKKETRDRRTVCAKTRDWVACKVQRKYNKLKRRSGEGKRGIRKRKAGEKKQGVQECEQQHEKKEEINGGKEREAYKETGDICLAYMPQPLPQTRSTNAHPTDRPPCGLLAMLAEIQLHFC